MTYADDGYEVVPDLLSSGYIDYLNKMARSIDANAPHLSMVHTRKVVDYQPFVGVVLNKAIAAKARECLGGEVSVVNTEYFFGKPGTKGFNPHQDNHYIQAPLGCMVSCWIALTDVDYRNGCLYVYRGSHKNGLQLIREKTPDNRVDTCYIPPGCERWTMPMEKGSAIFMHGELVHGSWSNTSDRGRESMTIAYIRKGSSFRPGRHGRVEIPVT